MTKRIFRSVLLVAVAVLIACLGIVTAILYDYLADTHEEQLEDAMELAIAGVEQNGEAYLASVTSNDYRITWIASDGTVLGDTRAQADTMGNHGDREEVKLALVQGVGSDSRYSDTLTEQTTYYARRLEDGTVLRISISHATVLALLLDMLQPILIVAVIAIVLGALLARRVARRVTEPLNQLDLDHPLENESYEELAPLLNRISAQRKQIKEQLSILKQKTDEFQQVTENMNEGLVLLDNKCLILSINPAAEALFETGDSCVGQEFLTVDRSHEVSTAIQRARNEGYSDLLVSRNGREYRFNISRIESGGVVVGAVLLAFDVTEMAAAERNRREFTANVSHELKTPLQSIIGSAELLENGIVKNEDVPRFVGRIRGEASRLVSLIEDIIRLSQLDERAEMTRESVNLLDVAEEVAAELQSTAAGRNVTLSVTGKAAVIEGVRRLLSEIAYNLCDNAIKYNVDGGSVTMSVTEEGEKVLLTVKDTGIGIPLEHQSRIFERFYRVDKSHSKASGGTGLGLSIVKHAAQYHGAEIDLQSAAGEGTAIIVRFPRKSDN